MATNSIETCPDGPDRAAERLAYSVDEAAHLTGLSRDLLYEQMRRGNLSYVLPHCETRTTSGQASRAKPLDSLQLPVPIVMRRRPSARI